MVSIALLLLGFLFLFLGAEWLIRGAAELAARMRLSKSFVGLTLVAFGTSAPEMVVNIIAAENPQLALSNVAGSNLANLCFGFGLASLFGAVIVERRRFGVDLAVMFVAPSIILVSFLVGSMAQPQVAYETVWVLLSCLGVYIVLLARRRGEEVEDASSEQSTTGHMRQVAEVATGGILLYSGGELVYQNAVHVATTWGVPEQIIGLTIVACGTSIPDITATVVAARRGEWELAAGNIIGSNISNILVVLTATTLVSGQSLIGSAELVIDYAAVVLISLAFAGVALTKQRLSSAFGMLAILAMISYYSIRVYNELYG